MPSDVAIRVGPFEVLDRLGSGGMAEVYRARHVDLGQVVALKVMTHQRAIDPLYRSDFRREVQSAARLNHPSIVRVFDYGIVDASVSGRFVAGSPYLVMEVADRGSLDRTRATSWGSVRRIVLQLLDALAYAHARGLVHRDVKPANLLLATAGDGRVRVKLADFGIAHAHSPEIPRTEGIAVGTFAYTPPEQLHGEWRRFGPPTDLYAVGCLVWHLVTGKPPFGTDTPSSVAMRQLAAPVPEFVPIFAVPDGLESWLRRLLEKQPQDRYARAADAALGFMSLGNTPGSESPAPVDSDIFLSPDAVTGELALTGHYADTIVMPTHLPELSNVDSAALASDAAVALQGAQAAPAARRSAPLDLRPRLPATWRRVDVAYDAEVAGLGLGLFGLREIPFVGREAERDAIWHALRLVLDERTTRIAVLRGVSGAGKTRLAQWITERADELGAAQVFRAAATAGLQRGLQDLVERALVTFGLDGEALHEHIAARLRELWPVAVHDLVGSDAVALAAIARPERAPRAAVADRVATVARLLSGAAQRRPLLLWLDDVQWDRELLALAQHLTTHGTLPLLGLLTVQEEALGDLADARQALAELLRQSTADTLVIPTLPDDEQAELVRRLIGLDAATSSDVARATRGNPLFAIHLVGDWVERGALLPTSAGFVLRETASVPPDLHTLWARRVRSVTARFGGTAQQITLEVAAALGGIARDDEWVAACRWAGVTAHEQLLPALVNQGMVLSEQGGWRFVHRLLTASLERLALDAGRWEAAHGACADALGELYAQMPDVACERQAAHYLAASRWADALEPLGRAAHNRLASRDYHRVAELVAQRRVALEAAGSGASARAHANQLLLEAVQTRRTAGGAEALFAEVLELAGAHGWDYEAGVAHHELGQTAATQGRLGEALEQYAQAWDRLQAAGDERELAALLESRAWVHKTRGDTAAAQADLEWALDTHQRRGDRMRELNTINSLAFTFLAAGDYPASREVAMHGVEIGREVGHRAAEAGCWTTLGEIARFEGALDDAREFYRRAYELDEICGNRHALLVRANAALVEVGARAWTHALREIDEVEPLMAARGEDWMGPFFELARACCFDGLGDHDRADAAWRHAVERIDSLGLVERDVAWLAEIAEQVARERGDHTRARRAVELAITQYEAMSDARALEDARARARQLI